MGIVGIVAAVALLAIIIAYNLLVRRRNAVDNAFAGMDAYLAMRYDLVPNLVAVVKEYTRYESATLASVTQLRSQSQRDSLGTNERVQIDNNINQAMMQIMALSESYPQLRAAESFQKLSAGLNEVEERIAASRRAFNAAATDLNNAIELFPISLIATAFGFRRRTLFFAPEMARVGVVLPESLTS